MADARLRELERRARTGDPQAEAEQLLARVRSGTLSRERVELAAYCLHRGAGLLAPDSVPEGGPARVDEFWVRGLHRWGLAPLRAAVAAARISLHASPCCPNHDDAAEDDFRRGCPSWPLTEKAIQDAEDFLAGGKLGSRLPASSHALTMHSVGYHLAEALWDVQCGHDKGSPNQTTCAWFEVETCGKLAGRFLVRAAIESALTAWALGGSP